MPKDDLTDWERVNTLIREALNESGEFVQVTSTRLDRVEAIAKTGCAFHIEISHFLPGHPYTERA